MCDSRWYFVIVQKHVGREGQNGDQEFKAALLEQKKNMFFHMFFLSMQKVVLIEI